jgi:hypothetical protein
MARKRLSQINDEQLTQITSLQAALGRAQRERDEAIAAQAKPVGTADDYQRERPARHAFPNQAPLAVSWNDLAQHFGQTQEDAASVLVYAQDIAAANDLEFRQSHTLRQLIEAFGESLTAARERDGMIEKIGEAFNLEETDPADILETLQDWGSKGTPDDVREDAITLLKDLGYDVRILLPSGYGAAVPSLDDTQVVHALAAQAPTH